MKLEQLDRIALELVAPGKGLLAADESTPTIAKRFGAIGLESTEDSRRAYREMLLTAPGLGRFVSGVILYDETLWQSASNGRSLVESLRRQGILPGIKVDAGAHGLAGFPGEKITEGLDGLRGRLTEYAQRGARFTKWRAVIGVGHGRPSQGALEANAHALARFAALSQEAGLVPIVEPEVLMDGNHTIEQHFAATEAAQRAVFRALAGARVRLEGMLLKPNMVLSGLDAPQPAATAEVAAMTMRCLRRTVPAAVPGIVFLSGGQDDISATRHLDAINRLPGAPWQLSFSYGRALQNAAIRRWGGKEGHVEAAQRKLLHRAACNSAARLGRYTAALERRGVPESASGRRSSNQKVLPSPKTDSTPT